MRDYNGFSSQQRNKAQRWLNAQWASGRLARPTQCVACGQVDGVIDAHAEDYSEPFRAGVTDGFHLCFCCHMMVHCRRRNDRRWMQYREIIEGGRRALPFIRRDWPRFAQQFLCGELRDEIFELSEIPTRLALFEIQLSQDKAFVRDSHLSLLPHDEDAQSRRLVATITRR